MTIGPDPMSNIVLMSSRFGIETPVSKNFIIIDEKHLKSDYKRVTQGYKARIEYDEFGGDNPLNGDLSVRWL